MISIEDAIKEKSAQVRASMELLEDGSECDSIAHRATLLTTSPGSWNREDPWSRQEPWNRYWSR